MDWRAETGKNMDTMDFDATRGVVVGMGMSSSSDGPNARVMVRLKMAPAAQRAPGGAAADHLNSPAAICEWSAGPPSYDHPIDFGGVSVLINASAHPAIGTRLLGKPPSSPLQARAGATERQLLVWLGSAPLSVTTDAMMFDAGTGEYVSQVTGVCTDPRGLCFSVMGAG